MAKSSVNVSQADMPAKPSATDKGGGGSPPKLKGMDSNPQGAFGPRFWQAFRDTVTHIYDSVSLPDPSEEARFTLATRTYPTPRAVLMRCQGTAFTMTRGPAMVARGGDQLIILLQLEGSVDTDSAGQRGRREPGDIAISDYARPFHAAATDYANLILVLPRDSVPAALLALEPHGLVFPRGSGAARLIGAALQELYAQADDLTVSEAEAAVEGIVALTTACARARLAGDETAHVKSRRKAALDHIDAHRTVLMAMGPWVKRGYVTHRNTSFPGLLKTIFRLLGMGPLNLYDATATDLSDIFTNQPDLTPYKVLPVDQRIFDPSKVRISTSGKPGVRMDKQ